MTHSLLLFTTDESSFANYNANPDKLCPDVHRYILYVFMYVYMYTCENVCMSVCMYSCMYVYMYLCFCLLCHRDSYSTSKQCAKNMFLWWKNIMRCKPCWGPGFRMTMNQSKLLLYPVSTSLQFNAIQSLIIKHDRSLQDINQQKL